MFTGPSIVGDDLTDEPNWRKNQAFAQTCLFFTKAAASIFTYVPTSPFPRRLMEGLSSFQILYVGAFPGLYDVKPNSSPTTSRTTFKELRRLYRTTRCESSPGQIAGHHFIRVCLPVTSLSELGVCKYSGRTRTQSGGSFCVNIARVTHPNFGSFRNGEQSYVSTTAFGGARKTL